MVETDVYDVYNQTGVQPGEQCGGEIESAYGGRTMNSDWQTEKERAMVISITKTDLWAEHPSGWSANGTWVEQWELVLTGNESDNAIRRKIKEMAGIQGWRTDDWAGTEWSWRQGSIGVYAEIVS